MKGKLARLARGAALALALCSPTLAQSYRDANGTLVPGVVPLVGCGQGVPCASAWAPVMEAALTTAVVVKAAPGATGRVQCDNIAGSVAAFVQLLNASASPSLGTNVVDYVPLAAGQSGGFALPVRFPVGISIGAATTATGSTAVSTAVNCAVDYN